MVDGLPRTCARIDLRSGGLRTVLREPARLTVLSIGHWDEVVPVAAPGRGGSLGIVSVVASHVHPSGGASVRVPMSREEWRARGETKHEEWSEGVLYVNPPSRWHVLAAKNLGRSLDDACPPGLTVYPDWGLQTPLGDFEPDLMVAPADLADDSYTSVAPLLVVEVASPTTRDLDWDRKRRAYAEAGVEWYWVLERSALVVMANVDGELVERQRIGAGEPSTTAGPLVIELDPATIAHG